MWKMLHLVVSLESGTAAVAVVAVETDDSCDYSDSCCCWCCCEVVVTSVLVWQQ